MGEVVNHLHGAYRQAVAIFLVLIDHRQELLEYAHLSDIALAPLLVDHGALGVDLLREQQQVVGPVVEYEQAGVLHALAGHGHVADVVDRLVEAGHGVEVAAEFHSHRFKIVDQILAGEVSGAVETHVLEEVGQSGLIVLLLHRSDLLGYVEVGLSLGVFVVTDVVG